jgi:hypothetical protein
MPGLSRDLEIACCDLRRHLCTAHRSGQMPLALVVCPATAPADPIRVVLDRIALDCALRQPGSPVRTLQHIQADWIDRFRRLVTAGLAPLGLVLVDANGLVSAGSWLDALAALHLSEERFHSAVNAAMAEVLPSSSGMCDEDADDFPTQYSC